MSPKVSFLFVIFVAFICMNINEIICPRPPRGWGYHGYGQRNSFGLQSFRYLSRGQRTLTPKKITQLNPAPTPNRPDDPTLENQSRRVQGPHRQAQQPHGISLEEFEEKKRYIEGVIMNDPCACPSPNYGFMQGKIGCMKALDKYLEIPRTMKGSICREAFLAACHKPEGPGQMRRCSFFIKTSPGNTAPVQGYWQPLIFCAEDLRIPEVELPVPSPRPGSSSSSQPNFSSAASGSSGISIVESIGDYEPNDWRHT